MYSKSSVLLPSNVDPFCVLLPSSVDPFYTRTHNARTLYEIVGPIDKVEFEEKLNKINTMMAMGQCFVPVTTTTTLPVEANSTEKNNGEVNTAALIHEMRALKDEMDAVETWMGAYKSKVSTIEVWKNNMEVWRKDLVLLRAPETKNELETM